MSDTLIEQNTDGLEEILAMAKNLPEGNGSSDPYKINPDLNLLVLGDSLFATEAGKRFINGLGCKVQNCAVSGASLADVSERLRDDGTYNSVYDQLSKFRAAVDTEKKEGKASGEGDLAFHEPDMVLVSGGGNDYITGAVMGNLNNYPTHYKLGTYDYTTVMGGLEQLLHWITLYYPKAQKFFLIMHRVWQHNEYTLLYGDRKYWHCNYCYVRVPYTNPSTGKTTWEHLYNQNNKLLTSTEEINAATTLKVREYQSGTNQYKAVTYDKASLYKNGNVNGELDQSKFQGHYTYNTLRENIVKGCQMYGFKIIDIYNESGLNAIRPQEITPEAKNGYWYINGYKTDVASSKALYETKHKYPHKDYFDWKGIHPTDLGYEIGYAPYVKAALCLGTKK